MAMVNGIKGFLIGIALVIPGLSGSIFAVVVGLYDKLLYTVNHFNQDRKEAVRFLMPIAVGAVIGILASTKIILWVCTKYPVPSYLFFTGLVLGSLPLVLRKIKTVSFKPYYLILSLTAFLCILFITEVAGLSAENEYIAIEALKGPGDFLNMAFAGLFSVSLMMIPGVSGSVMLMVINQYGTVYNAVGTVVELLAHVMKGRWSLAYSDLTTVLLIAPFLLGAAAGTIFIARILGYLLDRVEHLVYYCVLGLVAAAVYVLVKTGLMMHVPVGMSLRKLTAFILSCIVCVIVGFLCTVFLDQPDQS